MSVRHYTTEELNKRQSETDWKKLEIMTDEEVQQAAESDPDNPVLTSEEIAGMRPASEVLPDLAKAFRNSRGRPPKENPKVSTTIRLSAEVLEYFKEGGEGWQTRLDEVLKAYIAEHRKAA